MKRTGGMNVNDNGQGHLLTLTHLSSIHAFQRSSSLYVTACFDSQVSVRCPWVTYYICKGCIKCSVCLVICASITEIKV